MALSDGDVRMGAVELAYFNKVVQHLFYQIIAFPGYKHQTFN